ncbi:MAG TPA: hypothetical protein VN428_10590 [Bryobacteraceae bacterium]|nr:hypothetical protein [Bryobacteraceae bacterium]
MFNPYARWMNRWELQLAGRDKNRVERPFEWGLDWLDLDGAADPARALADAASGWLADSPSFYSYRIPADWELKDGRLTFTSPLPSRYPENDVVHAQWFPAGGDRAVVVLPQWNSDSEGHVGLCKLLNRFGISALRMSMAYHDHRMPAELSRADYHVSSNIGRTIHACRQSVLDARACFDWLESRGYSRLGILGTSLGSCVAFIALAHDPRIRIGVFNHASTFFGDVVWTGLSTQHVRKGLETVLTQDQVRDCWRVISPASYMDMLIGRKVPTLIVWGCYDTSFLPCFSREIIRGFRERKLDLRSIKLPCGHYTLGQPPFNYIDGLTMCRFIQKNL